MKTYKTAPLPFVGQKRKFLRAFKEALKEHETKPLFVDLFGGSGLLSHTVKREYPSATVVYNDYDNYRERLLAIPETNRLLAAIREIVGSYHKDSRLPEQIKQAILLLIANQSGFVDYITLSSSLLFSMKYVTSFEALTKETFYNVVKQADKQRAPVHPTSLRKVWRPSVGR